MPLAAAQDRRRFLIAQVSSSFTQFAMRTAGERRKSLPQFFPWFCVPICAISFPNIAQAAPERHMQEAPIFQWFYGRGAGV